MTSNNNTTSRPDAYVVPAPTTGESAPNKRSPPLGVSSLVALVLDMSRTRPGLVPTVLFFGQCPIFMRTQDRLQNVNHVSVTCPLCPATRLWVKEQK